MHGRSLWSTTWWATVGESFVTRCWHAGRTSGKGGRCAAPALPTGSSGTSLTTAELRLGCTPDGGAKLVSKSTSQ
eukprot:7114250-Pyramimonas_sp.AAC.1